MNKYEFLHQPPSYITFRFFPPLFPDNERQHIVFVVMLPGSCTTCTTCEAICVRIDCFSPGDNDSQLGTLWRNSCSTEINIQFGSLSPSSKILIKATEQFVPPTNPSCLLMLPSPSSQVSLWVCAYLWAYVRKDGQHTFTWQIIFPYTVCFVMHRCSNCTAVAEAHLLLAALLQWFGWMHLNTDFKTMTSFIISVHTTWQITFESRIISPANSRGIKEVTIQFTGLCLWCIFKWEV